MRVGVSSISRAADGSLFDYHMVCGHTIRSVDYRKVRNRILREPKTAHCDECKDEWKGEKCLSPHCECMDTLRDHCDALHMDRARTARMVKA